MQEYTMRAKYKKSAYSKARIYLNSKFGGWKWTISSIVLVGEQNYKVYYYIHKPLEDRAIYKS